MPRSRLLRLGILSLVPLSTLGCGDDVADPESSLAITPAVQWVGGEVRVSIPAWPGAPDLNVRIDGEPVDVRAADDASIAFTVPNPGLSRDALIEVVADGKVVGAGSLQVVGAALPTWRVDGTPRLASYDEPLGLTYHGVAASGGLFVAPFSDASGSYIGLLRLRSPTEPPARVAVLAGDELPGLVAPGPAAAEGAWLVDVSPPDVAQAPIVLQVAPSIGATAVLDCVGDGILGGYAIAELRSGDCLVLDHPGVGATSALTINGASPVPGYDVIPWEWSAGCVRFVAAAGGAWTTLRNGSDDFDPCPQEAAPPPPDWPVFDADGGLAFATRRYPAWPVGVGFSDGELWAVGETDAGWSLDRWEPATERLVAGYPLDGFQPCGDLATDPVESKVYVACWLDGAEYPRDLWPALLVFDAEGPTLEAVVETVVEGPALSPRPPYQLVVDGPADRVHFVTVWDGTTAPVERGVMGASYDLLGDE